jgi:hypothetical protein
MAFHSIRSILTFTSIIILCVVAIPNGPTQALGSDPAQLPILDVFIGQVSNGHEGELRGVYVPEILAASVVQQPEDDNDFVSPKQKVITQFGLASRFGSTGLLAHNYLAGARFTMLEQGQRVYLIYGNGEVSPFVVTEILRYQALQPTSSQSEFVDLEAGGLYTASDVFADVYKRPGQVIFQTCIAAEGDPSWGRVFVIAQPYYNKKHTPALRFSD